MPGKFLTNGVWDDIMKKTGRGPLTRSQRTALRRERLRKAGLSRVEIWVKSDQVPLVLYIADRIRQGAVVSVSPTSGYNADNLNVKAKEYDSMEPVSRPWTVETLKAALESSEDLLPGEFVCAVSSGADDVLEVSVEAVGGVRLYVAVDGEQLVTNTILWPRDAQDDPAAFESMMLRRHKDLLPLCALSIDEIEGREYYELFGSMSSRSVLASVVTEFRTIANNAIELATDLGPEQAAA